MNWDQGISIYAHIPFCQAKCHYCDFASYAGLGDLIEPYIAAVVTEAAYLSRAVDAKVLARTVYLGGGTPTLLNLGQFERLMTALPPRPADAEVTVEANPATVGVALLRGLRAFGINRLSLGVQSFDDALLRQLGRLHSAADAVESFEMARRAGFDNVSLDLIFGLPGQNCGKWAADLKRAVALGPEHLSLYGLTVENGTRFGELNRLGQLDVPDEDAQADMYLCAAELLGAAGYEHYEISNWAARIAGRPLRSQHNLVYWRNEPYLGLGAAAHSWFQGRRFANIADVPGYIGAITAGRSAIVSQERIGTALEMAETMMLGLRLAEGVTLQRFASRFGCSLMQRYGQTIAELAALGLLEVTTEGIALSSRGRLLGNEVFARFLSPPSPVL